MPVAAPHRRVVSDPGSSSSSRRPGRAAPYPSQAVERHTLRAANKPRVAARRVSAPTASPAVSGTASRQVLAEIDWWTIMAGQLPTNSSRTSIASDLASSSAGSVYSMSPEDVAFAFGGVDEDEGLLGSSSSRPCSAQGFAMDLDGELALAGSSALPCSRACSRPTTPSLFWASESSEPSSPSVASVSIPSSPPARRSFLHRAKSFAGFRSRSSSTSSSSSGAAARVSMGTSTDAKKGLKLRRL